MTSRSALAAIAAALLAVVSPRPAAADVERFALLVGNDVGEAGEQTLRYAERDPVKLRDVLIDLGGFRSENVVLVLGRSADDARRALGSLNDRIRALAAGTDAVLFVYYSGHADALALHMGDTPFTLTDLERLVSGSRATVRLLVVDACRSGSLTRVKGGRRVDTEYAIELDQRLAEQGLVFLSASSANEDAQESDDLRGSFFTHYLVSGLLGAADDDADGTVSLAEVYRHAYDSTLRASSKTLIGPQHPTYRFDVSGRGDLVLTWPGRGRGKRAVLSFPRDRDYMVMVGDANGAVVGEVGARDRRRRLSVRPGRYFIRARARDHLLEGSLSAAAGREHEVSDDLLRKVAYARLVRKGTEILERVHGPQIGARGHSALGNADRPCAGAFAGYLFEQQSFDAGVKLGWCRSGYDNETIETTVDEAAAELVLRKLWDPPVASIGPMLAVGAGVFRQGFDGPSDTPARWTAMGHAAAGIAAVFDLPDGLYAEIDALAAGYLFREQGDGNRAAPSLGVRIDASVGWRLGAD